MNDLDKVVWIIAFEEGLHKNLCVGENAVKPSQPHCSTKLGLKSKEAKEHICTQFGKTGRDLKTKARPWFY